MECGRAKGRAVWSGEGRFPASQIGWVERQAWKPDQPRRAIGRIERRGKAGAGMLQNEVVRPEVDS